jgi:hypothetical protein
MAGPCWLIYCFMAALCLHEAQEPP